MPEPQRQSLHFASTAFGHCVNKGGNIPIILAKPRRATFYSLKNYVHFTDSKHIHLKLNDQVLRSITYLVIHWTVDWFKWKKRFSQEPANFSINFTLVKMTSGLGREVPERFFKCLHDYEVLKANGFPGDCSIKIIRLKSVIVTRGTSSWLGDSYSSSTSSLSPSLPPPPPFFSFYFYF